MRAAADRGERVKVRGTGHSFTGAALTDGTLVDLSRYTALLSVDTEARLVTVQAGMRLADLSDALDRHGLALENLGDINVQTVAGATSTATHGTGLAFRNLSSNIVGMRIIDGSGEIHECGPDRHADLWEVCRVGVGGMGAVSTVTLRCVPAFQLHAVEMPMRIEEITESFDDWCRTVDHAEFFWIPHTRWGLTKRNTRNHEPPAPRGRVKEFVDDILLTNVAFGALCRIGRRWPDQVPRFAKLVPSVGSLDYNDRSDRVFASPRLVHFVEMEYAVPYEATLEAFGRVQQLVERLDQRITFPVEVRAVRGDDIPLSTAFGRDSGYIAVHCYVGTPYRAYFEGVEAIMADYGGRPHWGKLHFLDAERLAPRYPRWDDAMAVRDRLDPDRRFANDYLDRVWGP